VPLVARPQRGGGRGRGRGADTTVTPFQTCVVGRLATPIGMHKTNATASGQVMSDVDELYRLELGLENPLTFTRDTTGAASEIKFDQTRGWTVDSYKGVQRIAAYGADGGKRAAFVRFPDERAAIIVLTNDDSADAASIANRIADRLVVGRSK
jgi:hypothetical protein